MASARRSSSKSCHKKGIVMPEKTIPRPLPPPRPRSPSREYVGDEEVTRATDRELLLRALNEIFAMQHAIGQLTAGVAEAKTAALNANATASRVEQALITERSERQVADATEARERAESIPDLENVVDKKLAEHKLAAVTEEADKLEKTIDRRSDREWSIKLAIITAIVTAVITGGLAMVVRIMEASTRGHW
jgi:hypothetical protein